MSTGQAATLLSIAEQLLRLCAGGRPRLSLWQPALHEKKWGYACACRAASQLLHARTSRSMASPPSGDAGGTSRADAQRQLKAQLLQHCSAAPLLAATAASAAHAGPSTTTAATDADTTTSSSPDSPCNAIRGANGEAETPGCQEGTDGGPRARLAPEQVAGAAQLLASTLLAHWSLYTLVFSRPQQHTQHKEDLLVGFSPLHHRVMMPS